MKDKFRIDINKLLEVYGISNENWGDLPNFKGDYINYGYWKDIVLNKDKKITAVERVCSSIALYNEVVKNFDFPQNHFLEIGCGRGVGLIDVISKLDIDQITGIDLNQDQVNRAKKNISTRLRNSNKIVVFSASADSTTLLNNGIDGICSVEAAQHFSSIKKFALEAIRILKPTGKLVLTTYFPTNNKFLPELKKLLPLVKENLENVTPISEVCENILEAGFDKVTFDKIGEHVFEGYEKWIAQEKVKTPFSHNYYAAYKLGYIDYYIIKACMPKKNY